MSKRLGLAEGVRGWGLIRELFFCCFHSRLRSPKNQSMCFKKNMDEPLNILTIGPEQMNKCSGEEEPLNILTIGPEQMNKCSGENTLLALKN